MQYLTAPLLTLALFAVCFLFSVFLKLCLPEKPREKRKTNRRPARRERVYFVADLKPVSPDSFKKEEIAERERIFAEEKRLKN